MAKEKKSASKGTDSKSMTTKKASPAKKSEVSATVTKAAPTATYNKKLKDLEERVQALEKFFEEREESTSTIEFEIKFFGGAGQIQFKGENLDRVETGASQFHTEQSARKQRVQVGGTAPTGDNGRIEVQVKQGDEVISPFSDNVFKSGLFLSQIFYTVK